MTTPIRPLDPPAWKIATAVIVGIVLAAGAVGFLSWESARPKAYRYPPQTLPQTVPHNLPHTSCIVSFGDGPATGMNR